MEQARQDIDKLFRNHRTATDRFTRATEYKMNKTPALLVYTTYRLLADDVDAFRSLALRMATMAKKRDGCAFLDVAQDAKDPATFRLVEGWKDRAALDAHGASVEFQIVMKDAAALGVIDRSIDVYSVSEKRTITLPS